MSTGLISLDMNDIIKLENKLRKLAIKNGLSVDAQEELIANGTQRYQENRTNIDFFASPNYNIVEDIHALFFYNRSLQKDAISQAKKSIKENLEHTTPHLDK